MPNKTNFKANGSSYYRVTVTVGRKPDGSAIRKTFYGASKKDAEAKRDEYLSNINKGLHYDYDKAEIGEYMYMWLMNCVKPLRTANTLSRYMHVYNAYVKGSELFHMKLHDIHPLGLQSIYNRLSADGLRPSQVKDLNTVLRIFFNYCVTNEYMTSNPTKGVIIPKDPKQSTKQLDIFTDTEIQAILDASEGYMRCAAALAFGTGLRRGELLALTYGSVDFGKMEITVSRALKQNTVFESDTDRHNQFDFGPTKTNQMRTVPIPTDLVVILKRQIAEQKELFLKYGMKYSPEDLLFTTPACTMVDPEAFQRRWAKLLKRANVRYRRFHNVRHTYASKLLANGVSIKTISTLLGHSNINITADTYIHVDSDVKAQAADTISYLFRTVSE